MISHSKPFPLNLPFSHLLQVFSNSPLFQAIFHIPREVEIAGFNCIYEHVHLGVAVEDDIYKEARQQIEQELAHREAVETATRLLDEILEGVRTPERPRSPVDAYITVSAVSKVTGDSGGVWFLKDSLVRLLYPRRKVDCVNLTQIAMLISCTKGGFWAKGFALLLACLKIRIKHCREMTLEMTDGNVGVSMRFYRCLVW